MTVDAEAALMTTALSDRHVHARELTAILDVLPDVQGTALRLLYFERLSETDLAARMGITLRAARSAAAIGMRDLGEILLALPKEQPLAAR